MNNIKLVRELKGIKQRDMSRELKLNNPLFSQIETHIVMPTVEDAKRICKLLDCKITDLYDKKDLQYLPKRGSKRHCYNLSVRLPVEMGDKITDEILKKCGYASKADWLRACTRRLFAQYEIICKKEAVPKPKLGKTAMQSDLSSQGHINTII